ncbi:hypothetical protein D3C76_971230 [compost metagenome]
MLRRVPCLVLLQERSLALQCCYGNIKGFGREKPGNTKKSDNKKQRSEVHLQGDFSHPYAAL